MKRSWMVGCALLASAACDLGEGKGSVEVRISGQSFARSGWPTLDEGERIEFADGWEVRFTHVIVSVHAMRLSRGDDEVLSREPASYLVDVHEGDFPLWTLRDVGARRWDDVGYRFAPPADDNRVLGDIPEPIAARMQDEGLTMWIAGFGRKDGRTVTFEYAIPGEVDVTNCLNGRDETDGIVVGDGRTEEVEITLHMDHLFWDDHDAEQPRLLFGPMAYAAGDDDHVTLDELEVQRLTDLRDENGAPVLDDEGRPTVYVPREELPDNNLRDYIVDTAITIGHFNGEGHCSYAVAF